MTSPQSLAGKCLMLVAPNSVYQNSYLAMLSEWKQTGEPLVPQVLAFDHTDFPALIRRFEDNKAGRNMPPGYVPATTWWLLADLTDIVGAIEFRHSLNEFLLREGGHIGYGIRPAYRKRGFAKQQLALALDEIRAMGGYDRVLITCDNDNIGSAKTIMANGGILENEVQTVHKIKQRYWITL